jgi:hypothetical protein
MIQKRFSNSNLLARTAAFVAAAARCCNPVIYGTSCSGP